MTEDEREAQIKKVGNGGVIVQVKDQLPSAPSRKANDSIRTDTFAKSKRDGGRFSIREEVAGAVSDDCAQLILQGIGFFSREGAVQRDGSEGIGLVIMLLKINDKMRISCDNPHVQKEVAGVHSSATIEVTAKTKFIIV